MIRSFLNYETLEKLMWKIKQKKTTTIKKNWGTARWVYISFLWSQIKWIILKDFPQIQKNSAVSPNHNFCSLKTSHLHWLTVNFQIKQTYKKHAPHRRSFFKKTHPEDTCLFSMVCFTDEDGKRSSGLIADTKNVNDGLASSNAVALAC